MSVSFEKKLEALQLYEEGFHTISEICSIHQIALSTFKRWRYKKEKYGIDGLRKSTKWKLYSKELKASAIQDYLSGSYSVKDIVRKHEISSSSVFRKWLKKYNDHSEIKATGKGLTTMIKGRKTTWKERIEIVQDCLSGGKDYQETARKYEVSYNQVYQWMKKYEKDGAESLKDKRGRNKTEEELTPEDKAKLEMKRLEKENERLRAENALLKKLEEIERRRR